MGAPEVIWLAFVVGIPAVLVWCAVNLTRRRRNARHYVEALGRTAEGKLTADDQEFWDHAEEQWKP